MAKVSHILFCLRATNTPEQGLCATNILSALTPEYVPGLFSFSVIITLLDIEPLVNYNLAINFYTPEKKERIIHVKGPIMIDAIDNKIPSKYQGINLSMDWNNVEFKSSGEYVIEVILNEEILDEQVIYVKGKNTQ